MTEKRSALKKQTSAAVWAVLLTLVVSFPSGSAAEPPRQLLNATVFGPATTSPGAVLRISEFNTTDRPIKCTVDVHDALTGEFAERGEMIVPPKIGIVRDFNGLDASSFKESLVPTEDRLILISIVCIHWDREGVASPAPQIPLSAEWIFSDGSVHLIPPQVQSMSSGREGSSGEATAIVFGPATIQPDENLKISGFNTSRRTAKYSVDIRNVLTGEIIDDGEAIVSPKTGFTWLPELELVVPDAAYMLTPSESLVPGDSPDQLVVIAIIGILWGNQHSTGSPSPTPVSAEIGEECKPQCLGTRLLLPAVQAFR